jgi:hypothetical protein
MLRAWKTPDQQPGPDRRQAERLGKRGIACEQAGTPGTPQIDIAFTTLTAATGKEWLATWRRSIKK